MEAALREKAVMAGQTVALEAGFNHIIYTDAAKLVALVGGVLPAQICLLTP
jgi:hypothetical protein